MAGSKVTCNIPKTCGVAPKKVRKKMMIAVYEVTDELKNEECLSSVSGSAYGTPIRLCKGRLTNACHPKVCDCPDTECHQKMKKTAMLWLLVKMALFSYAVKEANRYGIWSDASRTADLTDDYLAWAEGFFPTMTQTVRTPYELYDMFTVTYNLKNVWNNTITGLTHFLSFTIPKLVSDAVEYVMPKQQKVVERPPEDLGKPEPQLDSFCKGTPAKWTI